MVIYTMVYVAEQLGIEKPSLIRANKELPIKKYPLKNVNGTLSLT